MTKDISLGEFDLSLLRGGPLHSLLVRAGIAREGMRGILARILFFVGITWVPLAILTASQGTLLNTSIKVPFLYDFSEVCRFLFVLPLLIVAESIVEPWLAHVLAHCRRLVSDEEVDRFNNFIAKAVRSRDSIYVELFLVALAFIRPHFQYMDLSAESVSWRTAVHAAPNLALMWYLYVAKPVIAFIWLRWLWKYIIWSILIVRISRLALRVVPTHPDHMGGLGFIAIGQSKFAVLVFAFAAQVSSVLGEEILFDGANLWDFRYMILGVVVLSLLVFLPPCLAFTPRLIESKRRGLLEYGALADQYTKAFHAKWIEGKRPDDEPLMGSSDIQSLADLANGFGVVQSMKSVIITKSTLLSFVICALVPFTPLLLTIYPFDEILKRLIKSFV